MISDNNAPVTNRYFSKVILNTSERDGPAPKLPRYYLNERWKVSCLLSKTFPLILVKLSDGRHFTLKLLQLLERRSESFHRFNAVLKRTLWHNFTGFPNNPVYERLNTVERRLNQIRSTEPRDINILKSLRNSSLGGHSSKLTYKIY